MARRKARCAAERERIAAVEAERMAAVEAERMAAAAKVRTAERESALQATLAKVIEKMQLTNEARERIAELMRGGDADEG